jgi:hypothetical protein
MCGAARGRLDETGAYYGGRIPGRKAKSVAIAGCQLSAISQKHIPPGVETCVRTHLRNLRNLRIIQEVRSRTATDSR